MKLLLRTTIMCRHLKQNCLNQIVLMHTAGRKDKEQEKAKTKNSTHGQHQGIGEVETAERSTP